MHIFFGGVIILIAAVWIAAPVSITWSLRKASGSVRLLGFVGGLLMAIGATGFFGSALAATGGLNGLSSTFQWPVGYASGVVTTASGFRVVPLNACGRIQVYDAQLHFVRGWWTDTQGKDFKLDVVNGDQIKVYANRNRLLIYDLQGQLLNQSTYGGVDAFNAVPAGESMLIPTFWPLWVFSNPFYSWALAAAGLISVIIAQKRARKEGVLPERNRSWGRSRGQDIPLPEIAPPPPAQQSENAQRVTVQRVGTGDFETGGAVASQSGCRDKFGCLASLLVWTCGWVMVGWTAIQRFSKSPDVSSFVGMSVSCTISVLAALLLVVAARNRGGGAVSRVSTPESISRKVQGGFVAVVFCVIAVMWNVGIFRALIEEARQGRGFFMTFLVLWALIGLFLLLILFTSISVAFDALLGGGQD